MCLPIIKGKREQIKKQRKKENKRKRERKKERKKERGGRQKEWKRKGSVFNPLRQHFSWTSLRREDKRKREREGERGENYDELVDSGSQFGVLNPAKSPIPLCLPQQLATHTCTHASYKLFTSYTFGNVELAFIHPPFPLLNKSTLLP